MKWKLSNFSILALGTIFFCAGLFFSPPADKVYVFVTFVGMALFLWGVIDAHFQSLRVDSEAKLKKIQDEVLDSCNQTKNKIRDVADGLGFDLTGDSSKNWKAATEMVGKLDKEWEAYDTTSGRNKEEFELQVQHALEKGCKYYRIICGSAVPKGDDFSATEEAWRSLKEIVDAKQHSKGDRRIIRDAIANGKFQMLHLPRSLEMDLFVVWHVKGGSEALMGFSTNIPESPTSEVYTSGVSGRSQAFAAHLREHFLNVLWTRADEHVKEAVRQKRSGSDHYCLCAEFYDEKLQSLAPRGAR